MFLEIAQLEISADRASAFEAIIPEVAAELAKAKGCGGVVGLHRSVERPGLYFMIVKWEAVENHTVDFAQSEGRARTTALLSPFLLSRPTVDHAQEVDLGLTS